MNEDTGSTPASDSPGRVVLPSLRTAHARDAFDTALGKGASPSEALTVALDTLEEDAFRWGNACPVCRKLTEWSIACHGHVCREHGFLEQGAVLLIGWNPWHSHLDGAR